MTLVKHLVLSAPESSLGTPLGPPILVLYSAIFPTTGKRLQYVIPSAYETLGGLFRLHTVYLNEAFGRSFGLNLIGL